MDWGALVTQTVIPLLVPLIIAGLKALIPRIPKVWLPVLAPLLGAAIDIAAYYAGVTAGASPVLAAALGSAGVGLREIVDQMKKAIQPSTV